MLIFEGLFYALGSGILALFLSVLLNPLTGYALEKSFWFFSYRFTIMPAFATIPIFALLGYLIPVLFYKSATKQSVVERLREVEQ
jgi:putative ABC transport system permease protein